MKRMELIDKNKLHNTLLFMESIEDLSYGKKIYDKVIQQVVNMPTIEPKRGHWIGIDDFPYETWECDRCGEIIEVDEPPNYCPNCGADMREVEE